ncbi:hypothetical protein [Methylosinus sporium]|uniref:Uncharacterized protein n=1 Tax=Methylosinus sporium TaxID=428 RepID=A0A2U1SSX5_METSR|nr:hypothetical protein [Methylosinus sporium]PWB94710.1 hypothetical protein C5689_06500 [Methylosinus sporium]
MDKTAILKKVFAEVEQRTGFTEDQIRNNTAGLRLGPIIDARAEVWGRLHFEHGWANTALQNEFDKDWRVIRNGLANWAKKQVAAA